MLGDHGDGVFLIARIVSTYAFYSAGVRLVTFLRTRSSLDGAGDASGVEPSWAVACRSVADEPSTAAIAGMELFRAARREDRVAIAFASESNPGAFIWSPWWSRAAVDKGTGPAQVDPRI